MVSKIHQETSQLLLQRGGCAFGRRKLAMHRPSGSTTRRWFSGVSLRDHHTIFAGPSKSSFLPVASKYTIQSCRHPDIHPDKSQSGDRVPHFLLCSIRRHSWLTCLLQMACCSWSRLVRLLLRAHVGKNKKHDHQWNVDETKPRRSDPTQT